MYFHRLKSILPQQTQRNFGGYFQRIQYNYGIEEYLSYDKQFGRDHSLNVVLGTGYYVTSGNKLFCYPIFNFV